MRGKVIKNLYKKEMLDVLRDKKTVVMMIIVPIILYPLLIIVGLYAMTSITTTMSKHVYRIAFSQGVDDSLVDYFKTDLKEDYAFEIVEFDNRGMDVLEEALQTELIDAYIVRDYNGSGVSESGYTEAASESYAVYYISSITNSNYAAGRLQDVIYAYNRDKSVQLLEEEGLDAEYILNPVSCSLEDEASSEESAGSLMGSIVPFMLIVSLLMGTMYPAIDTTAGERERGTLETMLTLPISNQELIFGKFLAVATIGILSAILNVISMGGVSVYMYNMIYSVSGSTGTINMAKFVPAIIVGILCIFAFAVFISAITMCVCAFARTYKEANNYITPLMLVVMFASFIGMVPNVELTTSMALVPVANICLLIKNMLAFKYSIGIIAVVLISNIAYGIMSVMLLGKIYNSEGILFGDSLSGIRIFERRGNMKKGSPVALGDMILVMAVTVILIIYSGSAVSLKSMTGGVVFTQLVIIGVPLFAAWYTRCDMKSAFKLKLPKLKDAFAAVFLIIGTMFLGMIITMVTSAIFQESAENVSESMDILMSGKFGLLILIVALLPAICEEFMFRGYILGALTARYKIWTAIVAAASIFGLYHMSIVKFFTTAFLGGVISYVAVKTGSILPGIIMHFINNATACLQVYYPERLANICPVLVKESFTVGDLLQVFIIGMVFFTIGYVMLNLHGRKMEKSLEN